MYDLYECNREDSSRYILGKKGKRTLFVVGLNPSTANKEKSDPTVAKTEKVALQNGFDGFVMTNLYPLRSTNPKELPADGKKNLIKKNVEAILEHASGGKESMFWAAWGGNIVTRSYLIDALIVLSEGIKKKNNRWMHFGDLTKKGHPRHPSRLAYKWNFLDFDIEAYLTNLRG